MVRVCGAGQAVHVENRVGEPCANPYLALAAQLSAGLAGVADEEASGEALPHGAAAGLPQSLRESLEAFRGGSAGPGLLGAPLAGCLDKLKSSELARFESWCGAARTDPAEVSDWEHREYFDVY
jgi:glutamine synthetase